MSRASSFISSAPPGRQPRSMSRGNRSRSSSTDSLYMANMDGTGLTPVQRWNGHAREATDWNCLRRDPEIFFPAGNCLIYLFSQSSSRRGPSFRIPYDFLLYSSCRPLIEQSLVSTLQTSLYHPGSTTPPSYENLTDPSSGEETYCSLYLDSPVGSTREEKFAYHVTTRNFFAWLVGVPLVGPDPVSALLDLKVRMDMWRDPGADNFGSLFQYVKEQGYGDFEDLEIQMGRQLDGNLSVSSAAPYRNGNAPEDEREPRRGRRLSISSLGERLRSTSSKIRRRLSRSRLRNEGREEPEDVRHAVYASAPSIASAVATSNSRISMPSSRMRSRQSSRAGSRTGSRASSMTRSIAPSVAQSTVSSVAPSYTTTIGPYISTSQPYFPSPSQPLQKKQSFTERAKEEIKKQAKRRLSWAAGPLKPSTPGSSPGSTERREWLESQTPVSVQSQDVRAQTVGFPYSAAATGGSPSTTTPCQRHTSTSHRAGLNPSGTCVCCDKPRQQDMLAPMSVAGPLNSSPRDSRRNSNFNAVSPISTYGRGFDRDSVISVSPSESANGRNGFSERHTATGYDSPNSSGSGGSHHGSGSGNSSSNENVNSDAFGQPPPIQPRSPKRLSATPSCKSAATLTPSTSAEEESKVSAESIASSITSSTASTQNQANERAKTKRKSLYAEIRVPNYGNGIDNDVSGGREDTHSLATSTTSTLKSKATSRRDSAYPYAPAVNGPRTARTSTASSNPLIFDRVVRLPPTPPSEPSTDNERDAKTTAAPSPSIFRPGTATTSLYGGRPPSSSYTNGTEAASITSTSTTTRDLESERNIDALIRELEEADIIAPPSIDLSSLSGSIRGGRGGGRASYRSEPFLGASRLFGLLELPAR